MNYLWVWESISYTYYSYLLFSTQSILPIPPLPLRGKPTIKVIKVFLVSKYNHVAPQYFNSETQTISCLLLIVPLLKLICLNSSTITKHCYECWNLYRTEHFDSQYYPLYWEYVGWRLALFFQRRKGISSTVMSWSNIIH